MCPERDPEQGEASLSPESDERLLEPPKPFDAWPEAIPLVRMLRDAEGRVVNVELEHISREEWVRQKMDLKEELARDVAEGKKSPEEMRDEYVFLRGGFRVDLSDAVDLE